MSRGRLSFTEACRHAIKKFENENNVPYLPAIYDEFRTPKAVYGYIEHYVLDSYRLDCYEDAIKGALERWNKDEPSCWEKAFRTAPITATKPVRVFDWGSGPGIASANLLHHHLRVRSVVQIDQSKHATEIGRKIIDSVACGVEVSEINKNLSDISAIDFRNRHIDIKNDHCMNVHCMFFVLDRMNREEINRFANLCSEFRGRNFLLVMTPSPGGKARTDYESIRRFANRLDTKQWNVKAFACTRARGVPRWIVG